MRCEHCGAEQASGRFCDNCGRMMTRVRLDAPADGPSAGKKALPAVLKCSACGNQQESGHFCDSCGLELDFYRVEEEEVILGGRCRQCGDWSKDRICPNCGIPIPHFEAGEE